MHVYLYCPTAAQKKPVNSVGDDSLLYYIYPIDDDKQSIHGTTQALLSRYVHICMNFYVLIKMARMPIRLHSNLIVDPAQWRAEFH